MDRVEWKNKVNDMDLETVNGHMKRLEESLEKEFTFEMFSGVLRTFTRKSNTFTETLEKAKHRLPALRERMKALGVSDDVVSHRFNTFYGKISYLDTIAKCLERLRSFELDPASPLKILPLHSDDTSEMNPRQQLVLFLLRNLSLDQCRKLGDRVMKPIYTSESYYTSAWEEVCTIEQYIHRSVQKETHFNLWKSLFTKGLKDSVISLLQNHEDADFPSLNKDRHVFAFRNGVYHIREDVFYPFGQYRPELIACKFTDLEFSKEEPNDPNVLDSILEYQGFNQEESFWIYVFLGRLLYNTGDMDTWKLVPFWKGEVSLIQWLCRLLYDANDTGVCSIRTDLYTISSHAERFLLLYHDTNGEFLEYDKFFSMAGGSVVHLPVKYRMEVPVRWKAPMSVFGTNPPRWNQLVIFPFSKPYDGTTESAQRARVYEEYPRILVKIARCYLHAVKTYGNDASDAIPTRFRFGNSKSPSERCC